MSIRRDTLKKYDSIEMSYRWGYVWAILKQNSKPPCTFSQESGMHSHQLLHYFLGRNEPSLFTLQCICINLERLTGVSRQTHSRIMLWGRDDHLKTQDQTIKEEKNKEE